MSRPAVVWEITLHLPDGEAGTALAEAWRDFAALPGYSLARCEAEAQLHLFLARLCWRDADRASAREQAAQAREKRRQAAASPESGHA